MLICSTEKVSIRMRIKSFAEVLKTAAENSQEPLVKIRGGDVILEAGKIIFQTYDTPTK